MENECADAAALYRRKFDWPCTAFGYAVWMLAGEVLDAVDVPDFFGPGMVDALRRKDRPHPVIEVPGDPDRWRFLVEPGASRPRDLVRELARHGAAYLSHAALIELPPTRVLGGALRWIHHPAGPVPALAHVVAALVTVVLDETRRSRTEHSEVIQNPD
jgi:hypothetical protein